MQSLIILTLAAASLADFIATSWPAAGLIKFLPELLSGLLTVLVLFEGIRSGFSRVAPKYWLVFALVLLIMLCGILSNGVGTGPIVAGMRVYLRPMPLFLVAAIFPLTDKQLRRQLKCILLLGLLQVPVACYQRYLIYSAGRHSGDDVRGTVGDSGVLSIVLICMALVLLGCFMRKQITKVQFLTLFFLILIPTTINETKATMLLLPIGLLTTVIGGSRSGTRLKVSALAVGLLVVFVSIMVPVYDMMERYNPYKNERHLLDFFTNQRQMDRYLNTKGGATVGTMHQIRRADALRVPVEYLARDPVRFAFGLGIGNASHSNLGQGFVGTYYDLFQFFVVTSFATFLLELGMLGVGIVFLLYAFTFFDAIAVSREDDEGVIGALAIGWIGVVAVIAASTFYTPIHVWPMLSFLYWYFSGVVAAARTELAFTKLKSRKTYALRLRPDTRSAITHNVISDPT